MISSYGNLLNSMKNIYLYFIYLPACNPPSLEVWFQKCHTTKVIAMDLWDCRIVHNAMVNPLAPGGHFYKMWTFQKGDDKMYDFGFVCYVTQTTKPHCKVDFKSSKNFYQIWIWLEWYTLPYYHRSLSSPIDKVLHVIGSCLWDNCSNLGLSTVP